MVHHAILRELLHNLWPAAVFDIIKFFIILVSLINSSVEYSIFG